MEVYILNIWHGTLCVVRHKGEGGKGELDTADDRKRPQNISFLGEKKRVILSYLEQNDQTSFSSYIVVR